MCFDISMKDSRSLDQSAQEILRIKSVRALIAGKTQDEVAELFGVSLKAVNNWWKIYRDNGMPGLRMKSRRPKSADEGGMYIDAAVATCKKLDQCRLECGPF